MIIPTNDNVLVKAIKREKLKTDSGIYLSGGTSQQEESLRYGEIISAGGTEYNEGDKIFYSAYSAVWVNDDNEEYQLLSQHDIMAKDEPK